MNNEEIDETEFYHQDFTTASEWEVFMAHMEEIINQWITDDLKNDDPSESYIWNIRTEKLPFADFDFNLTYYKKQDELNDILESNTCMKSKSYVDLAFDFNLQNVNNIHNDSCLNLWYGINEYIVLSSAMKSGINSESRIKVLLSSVHIVSNNINGQVPIFVQIRDKWQKCYLGVYETDEIRTNFEMVHLRKGPNHCQYLTGLLNLFHAKIMSPVNLEGIMTSVQLTYELQEFGNHVWKQNIFNTDADASDLEYLYALPFGVTVDPINSIVLKTTWSNLPDYVIVDSESYTEFDPLQAPKWSVLVKMAENPVTLLGDCLTEFLSLSNKTLSIGDILGDFVTVPVIDANPLDLLTESKVPTITTLLTRAARTSLTSSSQNQKDYPPIPYDILVPILYYLFPDADKEASNLYTMDSNEGDNESKVRKNCSQFKTCPVDSLIWRFSILAAHALQSLGGCRAFTHLWHEFLKEMRYRWEKSIFIPGLNRELPDLRTCLLNQKLQMLNCCIEKKINREDSQIWFESVETSSTDEEFFDCADKPEEEQKKRQQPLGRLGKFQSLKLIETGEYLYIPMTQEPVPKTEDQLEEDTDVLLKLGADAQGSELRARMMSASLLSDMESFKAANPGSTLEDFIRWYSPRDWEEGDEEDRWGQKKGILSPRMRIEDNIWLQMWKSAKPVPASRQKRLFDDTREAEKVLHFLESRNVSQVIELLLPVLFHTVVDKFAAELEQVNIEFPEAHSKLQSLIKTIERLTRESKQQQHIRRIETVIQEMTLLELKISEINSLLYKFCPQGDVVDYSSNFIGGLVIGNEIAVDRNSVIETRLVAMFSDAQKTGNSSIPAEGDTNARTSHVSSVFSTPAQREFVMRVIASKPAAYSTKSPQFLRAILSKNDFRLVGAFSEDIIFF